jgi:hypothetical protein
VGSNPTLGTNHFKIVPSSIKLTEVSRLNHEYHKAFEVFRAGESDNAGNAEFKWE